MTEHQKASDEWGKMKRRGYQLSKELVDKYLEDNNAPEKVLRAFKMVARPPTFVWTQNE